MNDHGTLLDPNVQIVPALYQPIRHSMGFIRIVLIFQFFRLKLNILKHFGYFGHRIRVLNSSGCILAVALPSAIFKSPTSAFHYGVVEALRLICRVSLCILFGLVYSSAFSSNGLAADDGDEIEYLPNPFAADRPEWDPYGPGQESYYTPGRAAWDPYSPNRYDSPRLLSANPFAPDTALSLGDEVLRPNQLYLQSGGLLVTSGQVSLGAPYTLWLYVSRWGTFDLYDGGGGSSPRALSARDGTGWTGMLRLWRPTIISST